MQAELPPPTLLERLGGPAAAARLVDAFYVAMHTRPDAAAIRAMHGDDFDSIRRVLTGYLREWLSRPSPATDQRGMPALANRHAHFAIDPAARDAWLACMRDALAAIGATPPLQAALMSAFGAVAERMRNRPDQAGAADADRADRAATN